MPPGNPSVVRRMVGPKMVRACNSESAGSKHGPESNWAKPEATAGAFVVAVSVASSSSPQGGGGGGSWNVPVRSTRPLVSATEMPTTLVGSNPAGNVKLPPPMLTILNHNGIGPPGVVIGGPFVTVVTSKVPKVWLLVSVSVTTTVYVPVESPSVVTWRSGAFVAGSRTLFGVAQIAG